MNKITTISVIILFLYSFGIYAQNSMGKSDDYSRIAIAPSISADQSELPSGAAKVLIGKMRQIISLNGLSALDDAPLFVMTPEIMLLSQDVTATSPPMHAYNLEVVFNLADRYTGNVYTSTTQALKGVGKTETAAYNAAFKQINTRNGKFKVMMEKGKEAIVEYYNTHCDLVISRAQSLASQKKYTEALAILNSIPPVSRECFDKANVVGAEIGANMPEQTVVVSSEETPEGGDPVYTSNQTIDLGDNIFLRFKYGKIVGDKTFLYYDLINNNEDDVIFTIDRIYKSMLINEKGEEIKINNMKIGSQSSTHTLHSTLIPEVNTEMVCEFAKVKEVKFVRFYISNNYFKFKNLPLTN